MNTTNPFPNVAHEHFAELSAIPVESIAAELESRLRARHDAPAGFHLKLTAGDIKDMLANPDWSGEWDGPTFMLDDSKITTGWNPDAGIYFFVDHDSDDPWPISQAGVLITAIQSLASMYAPDRDKTKPSPVKSPPAPAAGLIKCEPWCQDGKGHSEEAFAADQHCWSDSKPVPLATCNPQAPVGEPDILELYMHRPDDTRELVIGINLDRVHTPSAEMTKSEWHELVRAGNELWAASNG